VGAAGIWRLRLADEADGGDRGDPMRVDRVPSRHRRPRHRRWWAMTVVDLQAVPAPAPCAVGRSLLVGRPVRADHLERHDAGDCGADERGGRWLAVPGSGRR
jgi:hypothetical protein